MTRRAWPVELEPYVVQRFKDGASIKAIKRELGGNQRTISETLKRHGLQPFIGSKKHKFTDEQMTVIREMWEAGEPVEWIKRKLHSSEGRIKRELCEMGFEPEGRIFSGERHHLWRGGSLTTHGYRKVMVYPGESMFEMRDVKGYVLEHRLVMARHLGRPLRSNETVHHVNGDKLDNNIENLQLRQGKHGRGAKFRCADCGSTHIVGQPLD